MKDLTSYVSNFEKLILGNFLYVDKTEYIWQLIRPSSAVSIFASSTNALKVKYILFRAGVDCCFTLR